MRQQGECHVLVWKYVNVDRSCVSHSPYLVLLFSVSSEVGKTLAVKKKRYRPNKKRYRVSLFPRVVKRDIRRFLPQMLANVMNAADPLLMRSFFSTFALPSFAMMGPTETNVLNDVVKKPPHGDMDSVVMNFAVEQDLLPDLAISLDGAGIRQFLNRKDESHVVCRLTLMGTKLYEYEKCDSCHPMAITVDSYLEHLRPISKAVTEVEINNYSPPFSAVASTRKLLLRKPFQIFSQGILTLKLDENNRIKVLEYEACG